MYAIFEDGSHQHKVSVGDIVRVDFRRDESKKEERTGVSAGTRLEFSRVLLYAEGSDVRIGQPVVEGARVVGEVVDHPSVKHYIQKFRRRKTYRRLTGHRQFWTAVKVRDILLPGQTPASETKPAGQPTS